MNTGYVRYAQQTTSVSACVRAFVSACVRACVRAYEQVVGCGVRGAGI